MSEDNTRSQENSDLPVTGEPGLPDLVSRINNEIAEALRFERDEPVETGDELEDLGRHICIELNGKRLAIPLTSILEAGELQVVQSLPLLPDWLTGITNIRGEIISVVHLGLFLDKANLSTDELPSFLVVHDNEITVAITVDKILGTRSLYRQQTDPDEISEQIKPAEFFAGRAIYRENNEQEEVGLFDLKGFLASSRLRDLVDA